MESRRQLDAAGSTSAGRRLIRALAALAALVLMGGASSLFAQSPQQTVGLATVEQLFAQQRWEQIVRDVESIPRPDAELNFYYGSALAQLGRWDDARRAFLAGHHLQPTDKRFPIELGGVAFKQRRYSEASAWLRRGLRLDPADSYANDFLGTIYFVEGNLEAALKYWNRIGKPHIEEIRLLEPLRVDPALLDRAFAFAPASPLRLPDLLSTEARIRGLEIFPTYQVQLLAREDRAFDVVFRAEERDGWGSNLWAALLSSFRGVFYQTVYPEYFNWQGAARNITSLVRWDAQKRRLAATFSAPLEGNPRHRYHVGLDLRNENWSIRPSFQGPAPILGALNLRRESVDGGITSFTSGRWGWSTGAELSHRDYRSVFPGSALIPDVMAQGYQLKHLAQLNHELWRVPDRRFVVASSVSSQAATIWSNPRHTFEKLQASLSGEWFPQMRGDDYRLQERVRAGRTFGQVPFDELFMLGLERDNDLWLRAHIGTRDGRKGSAPLGRNYFLSNWDIDKNVYDSGLFAVKLSSFVDTGKITGSSAGLSSTKWLWDTGVQLKVRALGVGITLTYGRDLRSGNNAFYATAGR
jgi:tetratricopeptide (TPR) repeat protein